VQQQRHLVDLPHPLQRVFPGHATGQVSTRAKVATCPGEHERAHVGVVASDGEPLAQSGPQVVVDRVLALRAVERERQHAAVTAGYQNVVGHGSPPTRPSSN
jgi:hypothetical protein